MQLSYEQYQQIESVMPCQRGNVSVSNLDVLSAALYVAEHGCKWRGLPKQFGSWHTIYTRMNRWAKAGVLDRVFAELQRQQIIQVRVEPVSLESTAVKVHPDGTVALKKRTRGHRQIESRLGDQNSYGCRRCSNCGELCPVARSGRRRASGSRVA